MLEIIDDIVKKIEEILESIYMQKQKKVSEGYINLLDFFSKFIDIMQQIGYSVDINRELQQLEEAYSRKDYIELSDILLYDIRPQFEELRQNIK